MRYMIYFYGVNPSDYQSAVKERDIVSRVLARAKKKQCLTEQNLREIQSLVEAGIAGDWPHSEAPDGFVAFHWLMETIAEPILVERLLDFRRWSYWESTGLWDYFLAEPAPFPVPKSSKRVPNVGYLSVAGMKQLLRSESARDIENFDDSRPVHIEMLEIIESLVQDALPMMAIALD